MITPAPLSIAATTNTKTYDRTVSAAAAPTVTGLVGGDTASGVTEVYADKTAGTGKTLSVATYTINDGNGGNNYTTTTLGNTTGVIDPATLVGTVTAAGKTYDALTSATITGRALGGVIAGDTVTYSGGSATFADKNAGVGKLVTATGLGLSGADAANYTVNGTATTLADIDPLAIVGSVTAANRSYDGGTAATLLTRSLSGALGGDDVSYVGGVATFADKNAALAKTVSATGLALAGADAGNYTVNTTATAAADITPLAIAGSITAPNKVYDATTGATIGSRALSGVIGGDDVTYVGGSATFADKNAGVCKTVTATGLGITGGDAANYTVNATATTTANIDPLAIVGNVTAANKIYDGGTSAVLLTRSLSGVLGGDDVSYNGGAASFADKNVGVGKTVTATGLGLIGADAGNYSVNTTATTSADITPLAITGSVTANDKIYDGTVAATLAGATLSGVVAGDGVTYGGGSATFADRSAGVAKTVTASGLGSFRHRCGELHRQ